MGGYPKKYDDGKGKKGRKDRRRRKKRYSTEK
jgi:hypothetical protein